MKRIHDSLDHVFARSRLVFWYDGERQWEREFEEFERSGIQKLRVVGTELGTKVAIHRNPDTSTRYLLYFPSARPEDSENWLLDLLLQGHEYKADRISLALQEVGLPWEFRPVVEQHARFFDSGKRMAALRPLLDSEDDEGRLRIKMMAILADTEPDLDEMLLSFLQSGAEAAGELFGEDDPVAATFGTAKLTEAFWRQIGVLFGYESAHPSLRDFVTTLFRHANPLEPAVRLDRHAAVFLQRWKDSGSASASFRKWSEVMEQDLHIATKLDSLQDARSVESADAFGLFEKFTIKRLCNRFEENGSETEILTAIQARRRSFWFSDHADGYEALLHAVALRELIAGVELRVDTMDTGLRLYVSSWYRVDTAYRKFHFHLRNYGQVALMERIAELVEKLYVNNFLLPLADQWSDCIRGMERWTCAALPKQTDFFDRFVQPFLAKGQKVFVVVSDALRFEAAAEFVAQIRRENRWNADLSGMFGVLPSYTQLGMAALLPGKARRIEASHGTVTVDGASATGTEARQAILRGNLGVKAVAIQAEAFLEMNTATEARALTREHEVIFIYHNVIDKAGDSASTEVKTTAAVEEAFEELQKILSKISNANGSNMLLTADHGFLFQQSEVAQADETPLPEAAEWFNTNRRFALGRGIAENGTVKVFSAGQLGLGEGWDAAFPLSLGRFPIRGSGKRYVHGGLSLQEVVVPVVQVRKSRADDVSRVEVDCLRVPSRITTGQVGLTFYQDRPVGDKTLGRTLKVAVYSADGVLLSEESSLRFESTDPEPRNREQTLLLSLSRKADAYHNQDVEIRLDEQIAGTSQSTLYKSHKVRLHKPLASDFDE
jgi:uncharacterized protein (TIGR02687 family)